MNYGYQNSYLTNPIYQPNPYMNNYLSTLQTQNQVVQPQVQPNTQQPNGINGWFVDSKEIVYGVNADMSGNPLFFPSTDGSEIYCKKLDIKTGKSSVSTYKLEVPEDKEKSTEPPSIDMSLFNEQIEKLKEELSTNMSSVAKDMNELKDLVLESLTTPNGGGK